MKSFQLARAPVALLLAFLAARNSFAQDGRLSPGGVLNDHQTSIVYMPWSGQVGVDVPAVDRKFIGLTSLNINSTDAIFAGEPYNLDGPADVFLPDTISKTTFGDDIQVSFGRAAPRWLTEQFVLNDLFNVVGSLETGEGLGPVDLVYGTNGPSRMIEWEGVVTEPLLGYVNEDSPYVDLDFPKVGDYISGKVFANLHYQTFELDIPGWLAEGRGAGVGDVEEFPYRAAAGVDGIYGPGPQHLLVRYDGFGMVINEDGTGTFGLGSSPIRADNLPFVDYTVTLQVDITQAVVDGVEVVPPPPPPPPPYEPKPSLIEIAASGSVKTYRTGNEPFPEGVELPVEVGMPAGATWQFHTNVDSTDAPPQPITVWIGDDVEVTQSGDSVTVGSTSARWTGSLDPISIDGQPLRTLYFYTQVISRYGQDVGPLDDVTWDTSLLRGNAFLRVEDATKESYSPWTSTSVNIEFTSMESRAYFAGDANKDGLFDQHDLMQVLQAGKYATGEAAIWSDGDFNGDGVFDQFDIIQAQKDMPYLAGGTNALAAVPEPSTCVLLLIGSLGSLGMLRPRRRK